MEIYHFFGLLWTTQFIIAIGQTTIAGAIASWYWVHDKHDVPMFPVLFSFKRYLRLCDKNELIKILEHFGTIWDRWHLVP